MPVERPSSARPPLPPDSVAPGRRQDQERPPTRSYGDAPELPLGTYDSYALVVARDLRLSTLGKITAGDEAARVVEVIDDGQNTGGFLIFTYADAARSPEVFDVWLPSIVDVELYFDDRGWEVEWLAS